MTAPLSPDPLRERTVWHPDARDLARALRKIGGDGRRLYVFDIPPRLMRGLYAAAFAAPDGTVHRFLAPYYDPASLREEVRPLERVVRQLGARVVDGRLEIGANTGDRLHYFLANVDAAQGEEGVRERRRESREAWVEAALGLDRGRLRVRSVHGPGAGPVLAASAGGEHLLIRLEGEGQSLADTLRRLGYPERGGLGRLGAGSALHRDIMGQWAGRRPGT